MHLFKVLISRSLLFSGGMAAALCLFAGRIDAQVTILHSLGNGSVRDDRAHPGAFENIAVISINIASDGSGDWSVPNTNDDITDLRAAPYNYLTTKFVNAVTGILSVLHSAFPNAIVNQEVGCSGNLDPYPGPTPYQYSAATQVAQWGYASIPKGKFAIEKATFSAYSDSPAQALAALDGSLWYLPAQTINGSTNISGTTGSIPAGHY